MDTNIHMFSLTNTLMRVTHTPGYHTSHFEKNNFISQKKHEMLRTSAFRWQAADDNKDFQNTPYNTN